LISAFAARCRPWSGQHDQRQERLVYGADKYSRNTTIPVGSTVNTPVVIWLIVGDTITNNGTIHVPTSGSRFYFLGNNAQTYQGSGTCTIVTASGSVDLTMDIRLADH
jgi:hypothetical protein